MNNHQRQAYRERLQTIAKRLDGDARMLQAEALHATGGEGSGGLSNAPLHLGDLGTDASEQEMSVGLLQNAEHVLRAVAAALERLDAGTFGRCEQCCKDIPEGRLQAVPYAARCVACEKQAEQEDGLDTAEGAG